MTLLNQARQFVSDKFGPGETVTMDRGKLAWSLVEFVQRFETDEEENPELEKMRDKFNDWLDGRIARLKAPTNWVDITAEFVLEQIRDRENWDEVIDE
jgi:hypothetical protein